MFNWAGLSEANLRKLFVVAFWGATQNGAMLSLAVLRAAANTYEAAGPVPRDWHWLRFSSVRR